MASKRIEFFTEGFWVLRLRKRFAWIPKLHYKNEQIGVETNFSYSQNFQAICFRGTFFNYCGWTMVNFVMWDFPEFKSWRKFLHQFENLLRSSWCIFRNQEPYVWTFCKFFNTFRYYPFFFKFLNMLLFGVWEVFWMKFLKIDAKKGEKFVNADGNNRWTTELRR